ncbi:hypothetical protein LV78_000603 [Actinosynnema pretiosum]|nr:hypothetical protein [Actinosynnema pretiosum]
MSHLIGAAIRFPHRIVIITPVPVPDAYDNPAPAWDYGPDATRRVGWGRLTPAGSTESAEPGRRPVISRLELVTFDHLAERDHVEWKGRAYQVDGAPDVHEPRFGLVQYQARLKHVSG